MRRDLGKTGNNGGENLHINKRKKGQARGELHPLLPSSHRPTLTSPKHGVIASGSLNWPNILQRRQKHHSENRGPGPPPSYSRYTAQKTGPSDG